MHPVHNNYDGIFNTTSGQTIDLRNPTEENILIEDIAAALSKICRFGGNTSEFYSVAQHSVMVALIAPESCKFEALLHDASEAYLGDVISPLKHLLREYKMLENNFSKVIEKKFHLEVNATVREHIKHCDRMMLELEHEALQRNNPEKLAYVMYKHGLFHESPRWAWKPKEAERLFLNLFHQYNLEKR